MAARVNALTWDGHTPSFTRSNIHEPGQLAVLGVALLVCLACLAFATQRRRAMRCEVPQHELHLVHQAPIPAAVRAHAYNARSAWLEGGAFISGCFVVSWAAGVLDATFFHPTVLPPSEEPLPFWVFTLVSFAVVVVGYWIIWPMGTVAYGRSWNFYAVVFGLLDGLAESQLFLCIWAAVELLGLPRFGTGLVVFFVQGGFKANWDQRYWNVHVAPAHNVTECDKWKVLFVHVPNVLITFSYFITYNSATLYVATQTVALIGSTSAMRFPAPHSAYTNPPLETQVSSFSDKARAHRWLVDHWEEAPARGPREGAM